MSAKDYLCLPDMVVNDSFIELSPQDMAVYKKMQRQFLCKIDGERIAAATAAVLCMKAN